MNRSAIKRPLRQGQTRVLYKRWTDSRLVFGRLEMVDELQANGSCCLGSLVFLRERLVSLDGLDESKRLFALLECRSRW
jgi:hypothetical protein